MVRIGKSVAARALIVVAGVLLSTPLWAQQAEVCKDTADRALFGCLGELAGYTRWMVVPNSDGTPEKLQQAINSVYQALEQEWKGSLWKRTDLSRVWVLVPVCLGLYYLGLVAVRRVCRPVFRADANPRWRTEKFAIFAGAAVLVLILIGERGLTYYALQREYDLLPKAIEPVVHLRPPHELVNATNKPCESLFGGNSLLLARCNQAWTEQDPIKRSRLIERSRFTDPALINSLIAIGRACHRVDPLPEWVKTPTVGIGPIKMACPVFEAGLAAATVRKPTVRARLCN